MGHLVSIGFLSANASWDKIDTFNFVSTSPKI